jgi:hypothetical protein
LHSGVDTSPDTLRRECETLIAEALELPAPAAN